MGRREGFPVELIADGGETAASADFFRSPAFLGAEGATHTLRFEAEGREMAVPLIVRGIPGHDLLDAVSPYGYPGATFTGGSPGDPPDPTALDWSATGLVSVFARERLGGSPWLAGGRVRSEVQVHDPTRPRGVRTRLAEQIRHNERLGYAVAPVPGPEAAPDAVASFHALYTQTMARAAATDRYFFSLEYLAAILGFERSWLAIARAPDGAAAAGAIMALSDGLLHYFLGGTADAHLDASPFKNVVAAMVDLADELAVPLNLGGGVEPGDGLERFKRGFANGTLPFVTHEVVCDSGAYERLSSERAGAGAFFPAYRAP